MADSFRWVPGDVSAGMPVAQVYGWLLDDTGAVLIQDVGTGFNLPGGSPELSDGTDLVTTLRREAMEESQVTVEDPVLIGHEIQYRKGRPVALARMTGRIVEFLPRRPDPDGGRLFRRLMTPLDEAPSLLGWGHSGNEQATAVGIVAQSRWGLPVSARQLAPFYRD